MNDFLYIKVLFVVLLPLFWRNLSNQRFVNAIPQLDIPSNDSLPIRSYEREKVNLSPNYEREKNKPPPIYERENVDSPPASPLRISTNGHSDKTLATGDGGSSRENNIDANVEFNGDASNYDRDRSVRYGPPYSDDNDRYYYNNYNGNGNGYNANPHDYNRYGFNRTNYRYHTNDEDGPDDDEKYYAQKSPGPNPYYLSDKERIRYGYDDYVNYYRDVCYQNPQF